MLLVTAFRKNSFGHWPVWRKNGSGPGVAGGTKQSAPHILRQLQSLVHGLHAAHRLGFHSLFERTSKQTGHITAPVQRTLRLLEGTDLSNCKNLVFVKLRNDARHTENIDTNNTPTTKASNCRGCKAISPCQWATSASTTAATSAGTNKSRNGVGGGGAGVRPVRISLSMCGERNQNIGYSSAVAAPRTHCFND